MNNFNIDDIINEKKEDNENNIKDNENINSRNHSFAIIFLMEKIS